MIDFVIFISNIYKSTNRILMKITKEELEYMKNKPVFQTEGIVRAIYTK